MSSDDTPHNPAYPDGLTGILNQMNARRAPLSFAQGEALPPLDCDLAAIAKTRVKNPGKGSATRSENARKSWEIAKELTGQNALLHLNGLLIAHLRKRSQPSHTADLFQRLWAEQSDLLLREMDLRWKVSSLATFGDHGKTPAQRAAGLGLATLFGTMKLYESERLFSGRDADRPFTLDGRINGTLPLDMNAYALVDGGLDVNMIGRLWDEADQDDIIRPLAHDILQRLIDDHRTVFRRLHRLRARKLRRMEQKPPPPPSTGITVEVPKPAAATPSWGVVCTTNAPVLDATRFVAHHLELGAKHIYLFLDAPDQEVTDLLGDLPSISLTVCDADYWSDLGKERPEEHQLRQVFNSTRALRMAEGKVDWLGHIDVDEFILCKTKLATALKKVPPDMAGVRVFPAEALAPQNGKLPTRFKLRSTGRHVSPNAVHEIYPTFGSYVRGGFLSHLAGKVFARPGLDDMRLAIHRLRTQGQDVENIHILEDTYVGHLHAPDWDSFLRKLDFRQTKGSYRIRPGEPAKSVGRLLAYLQEEEGEDGLRQFFDELCADSADLRQRLQRHNLLLEPKFDPDAAIGKLFGVDIRG